MVAIGGQYTAILAAVKNESLGAQMEREILEQPLALAAANERFGNAFDSLGLGEYEQVVLVARGSSDNAALYLRYLIEIHLGMPAVLAAPSVYTVYGGEVRFRNALGVAISQSGQSPDVIAVTRSLREQGHDTLSITNSPNSPLAMETGFHIDLGIGEEKSIAATKTFTGFLLAAHHLARSLGAKLKAPRLPDDEWMSTSRSAAEAAVQVVTEASALFALARGYSFATAQETALKLMECALIPCKSYSTADFAHGPKAISGPEVGAIVFGEVSEELTRTGYRIIEAPDTGSEPDGPIREIVFSQFLALLAARHKGIDPDAAPNLSKVTRTY